MIKIPYGIGNFKRLRKDGYYYVDRTPYIEQLENDVAPFLFMLRPRRFGKSLFASMLSYYYDVNSKDEFQTLFGDLYIGQKPTKRANNYLILSFNFSGIDTSSPEKAYEDFTLKVKNSIEFFVHKYQHLFMLKDSMDFRKSKSPHACLNYLLTWYQKQNIDIPIYLLIDEYDHFANEILSFDLHRFQGMVGQNGWVRKFYETIKIGTEKDIIDRLYVTGVSPLTLDSLTSGFNIGINISTDYTYNEMLGFTRNEVQQMMLNVGVTADKLATVMVDVKQWYNGYRFSEEAEQQIYNPNMVLHFARDYAKRGKYPKQLLDANIATDYRKISRLFGVGNRMENEKMLEKLLDDGYVTAELTQKFNLA
ncbi:MAG: AAA family ATPase, partial [Chitinophagales bacterium]